VTAPSPTYRVSLESVDSGVSTRTCDEHGTPTDPPDDTIASETINNTALGCTFSGSWAHCWLIKTNRDAGTGHHFRGARAGRFYGSGRTGTARLRRRRRAAAGRALRR
jgi:hypothetical protein